MANTVTGLKGKNWMSELVNKRVMWLSHQLQNGGRGLTFEELKSKVMKELPGGNDINEKLIKKVAYGVDNDRIPTTWEEAWNILLPTGQGTRIWEEKREKERIRFLNQQKSRQEYNDRQKGHTKRRKTETHEAAKETTVSSIRQALVDLPEEVAEVVNQLKTVMKQHHYRKLELDLQEDGKANLALEPVPQMQYTQL